MSANDEVSKFGDEVESWLQAETSKEIIAVEGIEVLKDDEEDLTIIVFKTALGQATAVLSPEGIRELLRVIYLTIGD